MDKIASPADLVLKLEQLLAYAQGSNPSRAKLASALFDLAKGVAPAKTASERVAGGMDLFYKIVPQKDATDLYDRLIKEDMQTADLFTEVIQAIQKALDLDSGSEAALFRIMAAVHNRRSWDVDLLRNNIAKAANAVGVRIPFHSF